MRKTYTLHVAGLERELPLCPVNEKMDIAAFIMFSDVELTIACANLTSLSRQRQRVFRWPTK